MNQNAENIAKKVEFRSEQNQKSEHDVFESNVKHRLKIESKKREVHRDRQDLINDYKLKQEIKHQNAQAKCQE